MGQLGIGGRHALSCSYELALQHRAASGRVEKWLWSDHEVPAGKTQKKGRKLEDNPKPKAVDLSLEVALGPAS